MRKPSVTVRQIAESANVSIGTVSHVLNGSAAVTEERRRRVMDAVEKLGYRPSQLARGLRSNSTTMLGMIIPDITNPFFPGIVRGAEDLAFRHGYRLVLCNSDNDSAREISYLDDLRAFRPSGLLIIPSAPGPIMQSLRHSETSVVFVDRCPPEWDGDFVTTDNEGGAWQVGSHLLGLGHRRLAVITGPLNVSNAADRLLGFRRALAEAGVALGPESIQEARFNSESGYTAAMRLLQMVPRPTAIFASNDLLACGTLSAAEQLGLRCPDDLSIAGFDNLEFVEHTAPALTTVHQSGYQMGATACRVLLERIADPGKAPVRTVLPTELKIRNSTAAPPAAETGPSARGRRSAGALRV
ncbi:MAG TPA: LacI family DNA-binding transcriptional regulator [Acidobacteriaceae bacterium]|jgi:LacI family transcriptional regulator|nr:LacI family DNA-binding transcriptional regulator [Acidobacteriaceae bacterium]